MSNLKHFWFWFELNNSWEINFWSFSFFLSFYLSFFLNFSNHLLRAMKIIFINVQLNWRDMSLTSVFVLLLLLHSIESFFFSLFLLFFFCNYLFETFFCRLTRWNLHYVESIEQSSNLWFHLMGFYKICSLFSNMPNHWKVIPDNVR